MTLISLLFTGSGASLLSLSLFLLYRRGRIF